MTDVDRAPAEGESDQPVQRNALTPVWAATSRWLRNSRTGLLAVAAVVGVGAGFGAVAFRWMVYSFTWVVTGHRQFGVLGRVASTHLPSLGIWFVLVVPVVGGLIYGPLIQRFAREARGHGVPQVMIAVARDGGRIRHQVTVVKALASALCIAVGGSVGREGPIVQIGAALASNVGRLIRTPPPKVKILVACGAAGGISATFNAPITGVFFGCELILRVIAIESLLPIVLSSVLADVIGRAVFGSAPIFTRMPHNLLLPHIVDYLLVAVLGLLAGLVGVGFKMTLYGLLHFVDRRWAGWPEWLRPSVGGIALGALLLGVPQLYGVGYPVMDHAVAGGYVLWFLVILMLTKILATSVTISIGGSGGIFGPCLFVGAMGGTAFGVTVHHLFGPVVGSPAIYGVIAMGAVFASATRAPITAIASVLEMTGNYTLTVAVMLAVAVSTEVSRRLSYGTMYTMELLRHGIDLDRPGPPADVAPGTTG